MTTYQSKLYTKLMFHTNYDLSVNKFLNVADTFLHLNTFQ